MIQGLVLLCMCEGGGRWMGPLASTLSYTATCREKPRWSLRPCLRAMCRQTSRDVEAESTTTVRFSPVAKVIWIGMCFLDLTACGQTKTQVLCPRRPLGSAVCAGAPGTLRWEAGPPAPLPNPQPLRAHALGFWEAGPSEAPPSSASRVGSPGQQTSLLN